MFNNTRDVWRCYFSPHEQPYSDYLFATDLKLYNPGSYYVYLEYHELDQSPLYLGGETITAIDNNGFNVFRNDTVTGENNTLFSLSEVSDEGTLKVYINDELRYDKTVEKNQTIKLSASDLNIIDNDYYNIRAEYIIADTNEIVGLANYSTYVRITTSTKSFTDLYNYIYDSGNCFKHKETHLYDNYKYNPDTDYEHAGYGQGLPINDNGITIYGHGVTIDGSGMVPVFCLFDDYTDVYINDITFINCRSAYPNLGGGVLNNPENKGYIWFINCTFINNHGRGDGGALSGKGYAQICTFINNTAEGNGGALSGYSTAYSKFIGNAASGSGGAMNGGNAQSCTFEHNTALNDGGAIYNGGSQGGKFTQNHANGNGGAMYGAIRAESVTFENNSAGGNGGAIYNGTASGSYFKNNFVLGSGGAMYAGSATRCNFEMNFAILDSEEAYKTNLDDCTFANYTLKVTPDYIKTWEFSGEKLLVNLTDGDGNEVKGINTTLSIYCYGVFRQNVSCLTGDEWTVDLDQGYYTLIFNIHNSNTNKFNVTVVVLKTASITSETPNLQYGSEDKIKINLKSRGNFPIRKANLTVEFLGNVTNYTTDEDGNIFVSVSDLPAGDYNLTVSFDGEDYNLTTANVQFTVDKADSSISVDDVVMDYGSSVNVTVNTSNATSFKAQIDGRDAVIENNTIILSGLDVGNHTLLIKTVTDNNHESVYKIVNVTVNAKEVMEKLKTTLTTSSKITTTYGTGQYITVILNDASGKPLANQEISILLNGKTYSKKTDSNGKVSIAAVPKTLAVKNAHTAKITFEGDEVYLKSNTTVKVVVSKATPKLSAKAKAFKKSDKTKKYTVTLKTNKKVMKNTWITLKVNKKIYKVKTNSKGVATFKLTKLTKKGKYTANIRYAGSKYYNAKSVKVKITIK